MKIIVSTDSKEYTVIAKRWGGADTLFFDLILFNSKKKRYTNQ